MTRRFTLLVFDWDGTLMDSAGAIAESLQAACADLQLPIPSDATARHIIGLGLADALRYAVPRLSSTDYGKLVERYRHHFQTRETLLFAGVPEGLAELRARGFLLAIATGKSRRGLDRALAESGLARVFHASRCADEGHSKPHPGMLLHLMDELAAQPEETLMIGDTTHDMEMARSAGAGALACAYGAHPRTALEKASALWLADTFADVLGWIETHG